MPGAAASAGAALTSDNAVAAVSTAATAAADLRIEEGIIGSAWEQLVHNPYKPACTTLYSLLGERPPVPRTTPGAGANTHKWH
ncbi:hypothetical protein GCM10027199_70400 [Amycolatopsis magusensis]